MEKKKIFINNRKNQNISVLLELHDKPRGLAFVMHGLGGFKEQLHISLYARAFRNKGFSVVRFDTANSLGESGGNYNNATTTNYYQDLEDVINWSSKQKWFIKPYILAGHSLGGMCPFLYTFKHAKDIRALAPTSTVISRTLLEKSLGKKIITDWKTSGWFVEKSKSKPGVIKRLKWHFMEDLKKYDILKNAAKINVPVLLLVGESDPATTVVHQRLLFNKLKSQKELHVIKDAKHTFYAQNHLEKIQKIFEKWIDKLD